MIFQLRLNDADHNHKWYRRKIKCWSPRKVETAADH
jgi:hypothetical protein